MTTHIGIAEHMQLASVVLNIVIGFAAVAVTLIVISVALFDKWDDDANY